VNKSKNRDLKAALKRDDPDYHATVLNAFTVACCPDWALSRTRRASSLRSRLNAMNSHDVAIVPACEECDERWLPADSKPWRARAEFIPGSGPGDRLGFWCPDCWEREFRR
jgi:hypothetical protein